MNKGRVRDNAQLQYKIELIDKILKLKDKSKHSEYAVSLRRKRGSELEKILKITLDKL